jgi:hypothetical protein
MDKNQPSLTQLKAELARRQANKESPRTIRIWADGHAQQRGVSYGQFMHMLRMA